MLEPKADELVNTLVVEGAVTTVEALVASDVVGLLGVVVAVVDNDVEAVVDLEVVGVVDGDVVGDVVPVVVGVVRRISQNSPSVIGGQSHPNVIVNSCRTHTPPFSHSLKHVGRSMFKQASSGAICPEDRRHTAHGQVVLSCAK